MNKKFFGACFVVGLFASGLGFAADEPLVTDRPDATESAETIAKGKVQIEMGAQFSRDDIEAPGEGRLKITEGPATLVRVGLDARTELRIGWAGYISESFRSPLGNIDTTGEGNFSLGAKLKLNSRENLTQLALLAELSLPTGEEAFRPPRTDPKVLLLGANELTESISLGWNVGVGLESETLGSGDTTSRGVGLGSVAVGFSLTERWGAFAEIFGSQPFYSGGQEEYSLDGGVTYLSSDNVQWDIYTGVGINEDASDWFAGVGLSFRVP